MAKSMTGYGRGEYCENNITFSVEIKSVNHRYSDIAIKIPRMFLRLEEKVRKIANDYIYRGKVDIYITYDLFKQDIQVKIDDNLVAAYIESLNAIKEKYHIEDQITLSLISKFPDILKPDRVEQDEEEAWRVLENALKQAFEGFVTMRAHEGERLMKDIILKICEIEKLISAVEINGGDFIEEYKNRLLGRIKELTKEHAIDEDRILLEAAILADKSCVDEELVRLRSHIKEFKNTINNHDIVGKKLDFIVQEMNREINTIGSKAIDTSIINVVVNVKHEIEKIREQIQNIE